LDVLSVNTAFTYKAVLRAVAVTFLLAQTVVWACEIRAAGFKPWLRANITKSYIQYFSSLSRKDRIRLLGLWAFLFVGAMLILAVP